MRAIAVTRIKALAHLARTVLKFRQAKPRIAQLAMTGPRVDWNKAFEFAWRILVFAVAIGIIIVVSTNWTRWEGGTG